MPPSQERSSWPSVGDEERPWRSAQIEDVQRKPSARNLGPYSASVPAFIAELDIPLNGDLPALIEETASELARFDTDVGHTTAPFGSVLLRAESAASSAIEHISSDAREIALAELGVQVSETAQLISGNSRAMQAALSSWESLDGDAILEIHRALLERSNPEIVGRWRDQPVWIGGGSRGPHFARFVPPHQDRVAALMDDLLVFANRVDAPVLTQAAITHAQFETIHPFPDGNGRVGRALIQAMLRGGRLTRNVTVPISAGLLPDTDGYFDALSAYRAGDVAPIIRSITHASLAAMNESRHLMTDLRAVQGEWRERVSFRRGSAAHRLGDLLLRQSAISATFVAAELGVSTVNAQAAIDRFVDANILTQITQGRRNRIWLAEDVVGALDDFAARARQRR